MIYLSLIESESDKIKFTQIYEQYRYTMLYTAMRILKDQERAEDAVHDACLKIIANLDKFPEILCNQTKSLIVIIVKNTAIDILRKEERLSKVPFEVAENALPGDDADPLETLISEQGYKLLVDSIDKLGEIYKITLQLKYVHSYTNHEIAKLLDISLDNVNIRLYRAKRLLKEILKEGEDID